jgi:transcriptional regulator with XRE-family HTH domain
MLELYKNIKKLREENDLSQEELAKRVGYSDKSMISRIESGKVDLTQNKILLFADVFKVTPGELMGDTIRTMEERIQEHNDLIRAYEKAPEYIQKTINDLLGL